MLLKNWNLEVQYYNFEVIRFFVNAGVVWKIINIKQVNPDFSYRI